ncbi:MAG: DUF1559 domain-containing protein [Planctomycetaceae bacterium]|nr:DUF1559 domain-containing protein [Planctomycetaceae bacterium]
MYPDPDMHSPPQDLLKTGSLREQSPLLFWGSTLFIVILLGIVFVSLVQNARLAARRSRSNCSLKQIGMAAFNFEDIKGDLPPHSITDPAGVPLHSWCTELLPYMDASKLYLSIDQSKAWNHPDNAEYFKTPIGSYSTCGNDYKFSPSGYALSLYSANSRLLKVNKVTPRESITDGSSNTLLFGEIGAAQPPWGEPGNVRDPAAGLGKSATTFGGLFKGSTQFTFADGSVRAISNDIDPAILKALATPDAGDDLKEYVP